MLNADALANDPSGMARLRAVLETDPGYAERRSAAARRLFPVPRLRALPRRPAMLLAVRG